MLVAEACGALAPLVAPEMRPSLVLSMLAQLASDAEPAVRASAAAALAALLPHLPTLDKYGTVRPRPRVNDNCHAKYPLLACNTLGMLYVCSIWLWPAAAFGGASKASLAYQA